MKFGLPIIALFFLSTNSYAGLELVHDRFEHYMKCYESIADKSDRSPSSEYYFKQPKHAVIVPSWQLVAGKGRVCGLLAYTKAGACFYEIPGGADQWNGLRLQLPGGGNLDLDYTFDEDRHASLETSTPIGHKVRSPTDALIAESVGYKDVTTEDISEVIQLPVQIDLKRAAGSPADATPVSCEDVSDETVKPTAEVRFRELLEKRLNSLKKKDFEPLHRQKMLEACVDAFKALPSKYRGYGQPDAELLAELTRELSDATSARVRAERGLSGGSTADGSVTR